MLKVAYISNEMLTEYVLCMFGYSIQQGRRELHGLGISFLSLSVEWRK